MHKCSYPHTHPLQRDGNEEITFYLYIAAGVFASMQGVIAAKAGQAQGEKHNSHRLGVDMESPLVAGHGIEAIINLLVNTIAVIDNDLPVGANKRRIAWYLQYV